MKKLLIPGVLLFFMATTLGPIPAQAFNSATHIYIADRVFPKCIDKIDLYYGSIAPDLDMFVIDNWLHPFDDTHWIYIDLTRYATNFPQRAFAKGWRTHGENIDERGADYYAHGPQLFPPYYDYNGYVIQKAKILIPGAEGLILDFAHTIIETAVDLLIKYNLNPNIGETLLNACQNRSLQDLSLLEKVFVYEEEVTNWVTLVSAESFFREITIQYANAFSLSPDRDQKALARLIARIAQEMYGIDIKPHLVLELLRYSISLCEEDYQQVIDAAIEGIKEYLEN